MLLGKKKILFRNCNLKCLPTTSKTNQVNYIAGDLHFIVTKCVSCTGHSYMLKYSTRKLKELLRLVNSGMMVTEISSCIQAVSGKVSPNLSSCAAFFIGWVIWNNTSHTNFNLYCKQGKTVDIIYIWIYKILLFILIKLLQFAVWRWA